MKYQVPEYSQHRHIADALWREHACGIVALKMVLDYWAPVVGFVFESADELLERGLKEDGFIKGVGWKHATIARLGESGGLIGKPFDWAALTSSEAWDNLGVLLQKGPIIASIYPGLNPDRGGGHLVVIIGLEGTAVYYNDPDAREGELVARSASVDVFLRGWKKRAILISADKSVN